MPRNPQLNEKGALQHLLTIEGLPREILTHILDTAASFINVAERDVKKVPLLRGKSVFNLFFEASTRTRTTFEIAAKRLSADVINLNIATSSQTKGETLLDTIDNLSAMHADMFVVRTSSMRATAGTLTRPRGCSTPTPSGTTSAISPGLRWLSSATCCTRALRARSSTR